MLFEKRASCWGRALRLGYGDRAGAKRFLDGFARPLLAHSCDRRIEFISNKKINQLIEVLIESEHALFAGLGSSGLTATEFYYRTMRMGIKGNSATDVHQIKIGASLLTERDTFIALSNSGETKELVNAVKIAKDHGATIIAITNYAGSPLSALSDITIMTIDQTRINDHQFINTQISAHFLIDVVSYMLLSHESHLTQYDHTKEVILKDNNS